MLFRFGTDQTSGLTAIWLFMQLWSFATAANTLASELFTMVNCATQGVSDWDVVLSGASSLAGAASSVISTILNTPMTQEQFQSADETIQQLFLDTWWMYNVQLGEDGISADDTTRLQTIQSNFEAVVSQLIPGTTIALQTVGSNFLICEPATAFAWTQDISLIDPNEVLSAEVRATIPLGVYYLEGQVDVNGVPYFMWPAPTQVDVCSSGVVAGHLTGNWGYNMIYFCPRFYNYPQNLYDQTSDTKFVDDRATMSSYFMHEFLHWLFGWRDEVINWQNSPFGNGINGITAYQFAATHILALSGGISTYTTAASLQCDVNPDNYRVYADMTWAPTTVWTMPPPPQ
ncbi:hypothetical protein BX600DRAFT_496998 [Xylariales sp. PMI_506]|nr:hypothetical protein BX600DRAFT_496998 [Xylariales sp. PMI_506]